VVAPKVAFTDTQMLAEMPLVLEDGRTLPVWSLPDHPTMFGWDDGQATSIVADIRFTPQGQRLFVSIGNPFWAPPDDLVLLIERALFAEGTCVEGRRGQVKEGRVTTYTVTIEEVIDDQRTPQASSWRRSDQASFEGAVA